MGIIEAQSAIIVFYICYCPGAVYRLNRVKSYERVDVIRKPVKSRAIIPFFLGGVVCGLAPVHKHGEVAFTPCKGHIAIDGERLCGEIGSSCHARASWFGRDEYQLLRSGTRWLRVFRRA